LSADDLLLAATPILNFDHPSIARLVKDGGWNALSTHDRVGAVYDFVRNEIAFSYNRAGDITAAGVLAVGFGQCNTKGTLLMAVVAHGFERPDRWRFYGGLRQQIRLHFERTAQRDDMHPVVKTARSVL